MQKLYLDTSVVSALFDERTPERLLQTKAAWTDFDKYDVCISTLVIDELSNAPQVMKKCFLKAVAGFTVLEISDEAQHLAQQYVVRGIFPDKYRDDAVHVAVAATNGIGILISWNFTHLVKLKTRRLVALVNAEDEYLPVEIISPPEL
jgi:predicted nucleic acid-binding protein